MSKFENKWYNKGYEDGFSDAANSINSIEFELEEYIIWKDDKIIGCIDLTEEQKEALNKINGINVYFGTEYGGKPNGNDENEERIQ